MSESRLITGATGFVGQYLLLAALQQRTTCCVLIRKRYGFSPSARIDYLISRWEERLGRILPRPVVLEGDICQERLGLDAESERWFRRNITSVVHCAASVVFEETSSGEPLRTNVDGTQHLLDLCCHSSVNDFHYVSTAYSCGRGNLSDVVREELHAIDGPFGNIYEQSKCLAEHLVQRSPGEFTRTIYRPSVIVGESTTGFAPAFSALYAPLRLAATVTREASGIIRSKQEFLQQIEMSGTDSRNLVPIDWVSTAIDAIVNRPHLHGNVYHLTNPSPTNDREIISCMADAIAGASSAIEEGRGTELKAESSNAGEGMEFSRFRKHLHSFQSYFQSDPVFDCRNILAIDEIPQCPLVEQEMLRRIFRYAVDAEFKSDLVPTKTQSEPNCRLNHLSVSHEETVVARRRTPISPSRNISPLTRESQASPPDSLQSSPVSDVLLLTVTGPGGGCWQITKSDAGICCDRPNSEVDAGLHLYCSATSFRAWMRDEISFAVGIRTGSFIFTSATLNIADLESFMLALSAELKMNNQPSRPNRRSKRVQNTRELGAIGLESGR